MGGRGVIASHRELPPLPWASGETERDQEGREESGKRRERHREEALERGAKRETCGDTERRDRQHSRNTDPGTHTHGQGHRSTEAQGLGEGHSSQLPLRPEPQHLQDTVGTS